MSASARTAAPARCTARRKLVNAVALALSLAAMAFGLFWLLWILVETHPPGHRRPVAPTLHQDDAAAAAETAASPTRSSAG